MSLLAWSDSSERCYCQQHLCVVCLHGCGYLCAHVKAGARCWASTSNTLCFKSWDKVSGDVNSVPHAYTESTHSRSHFSTFTFCTLEQVFLKRVTKKEQMMSESQIDSQWNDSVGIFCFRRLIFPFPHSWSTDLSYWTRLVQHSLSPGPGRITAHASFRAHPAAQQNDCSTWAVISFIFFPQRQVPGSWCQGQKQHHCFAASKAGCMLTTLCGSGWAPHAPLPGDSVSWFLCNRNICPVDTVLGDY